MAQTTAGRWLMGAARVSVAMPVLMAGRLWAGQAAPAADDDTGRRC